MKTIIFDTETTGLNPGNICQLSYVIIDDDNIIAKNYFFKVNFIEPGAQRVHGFSVTKLIELSENRNFTEQHEIIYNDFNDVDVLVAHNFSFDIRFITKEFTSCDKKMNYGKSFCTMRSFTHLCQLKKWGGGMKYPNLGEMMTAFNVSQELVKQKVTELYGNDKTGFHDARYDAVATYLCYLEGSKML